MRPSRKSGMGRRTLSKVLDGLGDPTIGPERVGGPSEKSRMGREILPEFRDGLKDPPKFL